MSTSFVIAGAGLAGLSVAEALRAQGHEGPITLIGVEPCLPYHRPPLSKGFLAGSVPRAQLDMRSPAALERKGIRLMTGLRAISIDRSAARLVCADGSQLAYDGLALCTGARVRPLQVPGAELAGVFHLRTVQDAQAIQAALETVQDIVIIGGGFIGLEACASLRALGKRVTVLEASDRLMARAVGPAVSEYFHQLHEARGAQVITGAVVSELEGCAGRVRVVHTASGLRFKADLVLVGIGVLPNDEMASEAGLQTRTGIVVDDRGKTSDPAIFAAGDCTVRLTGDGSYRRLESIHNAVEQGRAAGTALLGKPVPRAATPWFYSDQYDTKLQIVGVATGAEQTVIRQGSEAHRFAAFHFRRGELLAVESVNQPAEHMRLRKLFDRQTLPSTEQASDPGFGLETLLAEPVQT